jgi:ligand-binding sensor domain-containing protein/signal transduction histidine kinase
MSQYVRQRWGLEEGFPRGPVYSIAQTADGYLWIGTEKGLVRFDGLSFHLMQSATPEQPSLSHVLGLVADVDGGLWLRLRRPGLTLLRYDNGGFRDVMGDLATRSSVSAMTRGKDGGMLFCLLEGRASEIVIRGKEFEELASPPGLFRTAVLAIAQTSSGEVWVGTSDAGLFRIRDGQASSVTAGLPDMKVNALVPTPNDGLWVGTDGGLVRWDGTKLVDDPATRSLRGVQVLAMTLDRNANLWVGTNTRGLVRVNEKGVSWMDGPEERTRPAVTAIFEDREGNLWTGSASGLERIRDSVFVTYSSAEGLPSDSAGPIYVDPENRAWFAPIDGGLSWLRESELQRVEQAKLNTDVVYSIAGGKDGLWIGRQRGGLTHLRPQGSSFAATTYTADQGLAQDSVYSVFESRDGAVWAGTLSGGVSRLHGGKFTNYTSADGLASNTVASILEASDGAMWFATPNGLSRLSNGRWQTYTAADGLPSEEINCLLEDSAGGLWIGTSSGLAFRNVEGIQTPASAPDSLREPILGIAEDGSESLWIATATRVLRVRRDELLNGPLTDGDVREYSTADGLRGVEGVKRHQSVVRDSLGRIWFSTSRGISVVHPELLSGSSPPAIVHVQTISVDGRRVDLRGAVRIPPGRQRLTMGFAGLSLAVPERVQFRYRLDGFDHDWSEPAATRQAVYTNLSPGSYTFRVIASNVEGVWNSAEGSLAFTVDPAFWQTWWFRLGGVLTCILGIAALYRFRVHQVTRQLNVRFEERLAERTRIAQELHDTLLQGFLSASMQLHVAADKVPDGSPVKPSLNRVLSLMGQVIDEGRNAVRGLRSSPGVSGDLEEAFSRIEQELGGQDAVNYRVIVEGHAQALHPILRDEVYRIGREAVVNAFRHAQAKNIEIEIEYRLKRFRFLVRDDGCGIDPKILESGREGHWGLPGMRERAERIGGRLSVWSRASAGTEVELSVPSHVAFQSPTANAAPRWFSRLRSGRANTNEEVLKKHK